MSAAANFSLIDVFEEEVRSHAAPLNQGLLDLENDVANPQKIEPLMRAAHSIKGAARIVNIDSAVQLAHVMEDAFVAAQEGRIRITSADIDMLLRGTDLLAQLGQGEERDVAGWATARSTEIEDLKERFREIAAGRGNRPTPATPPSATTALSPPAPSPPEASSSTTQSPLPAPVTAVQVLDSPRPEREMLAEVAVLPTDEKPS